MSPKETKNETVIIQLLGTDMPSTFALFQQQANQFKGLEHIAIAKSVNKANQIVLPAGMDFQDECVTNFKAAAAKKGWKYVIKGEEAYGVLPDELKPKDSDSLWKEKVDAVQAENDKLQEEIAAGKSGASGDADRIAELEKQVAALSKK